MSTEQRVERDERTVAVENYSYRSAYFFVLIALYADANYRVWVRHEAPWDLLALAIVPGIACTIYQARQKVLGQSWVRMAVIIECVFGLLGGLFGAILSVTGAR